MIWMIISFLLGAFVGFLFMGMITVGKISDQEDEISRLKYRLYGKEKNSKEADKNE